MKAAPLFPPLLSEKWRRVLFDVNAVAEGSDGVPPLQRWKKVPGLNWSRLHSSNRLCLCSDQETNHTITLLGRSHAADL